MKPNVYTAGFPRTASTYLYHLLEQHPEIDVGSIKEPSYMGKYYYFLDYPHVVSPNSKKSLDWYKSLWGDKNIRIDFTIYTSYDSSSIKRIKDTLGDIKIMFLVRDKDKHEESAYYRFRKNGGLLINTFEEYKLSNHPFLKYSDFDKHIENYKEVFSEVGVFNFIDNPTNSELKKILKFIGVKDIYFKFNFDVYKNKGPRKKSISNGRYYRFKRKILVYLFPFLIRPQNYPQYTPPSITSYIIKKIREIFKRQETSKFK